jgi:16S rRNA (uracil1498-N3)-methyltransferase
MEGRQEEQQRMPAGRFYVEGIALAASAELAQPDEVAHQARDVLRLAPGDTLALLDGAGGEYPATIVTMDRKHVVVQLRAREEGTAEPPVRVVLLQGMLKAAKLELVLQKCTELGVAAFVPLLTERAVAAAEEAGEGKRRRWARIVAEAMEQCGGARLPELHAPQPLTHALADAPPVALVLIPWEEERHTTLRLAVEEHRRAHGAPSEVRLFIGPEGASQRARSRWHAGTVPCPSPSAAASSAPRPPPSPPPPSPPPPSPRSKRQNEVATRRKRRSTEFNEGRLEDV